MFIIKIKEMATHRTRSYTHQACTNCSSHGGCKSFKSNNFRTRNQQDQHVRTAALENVSSDDDVYVFQIGNKSNTYPVLINDTEINVIVDSGSTINTLDETSFDSIMPQSRLEKSSTKICLTITTTRCNWCYHHWKPDITINKILHCQKQFWVITRETNHYSSRSSSCGSTQSYCRHQCTIR